MCANSLGVALLMLVASPALGRVWTDNTGRMQAEAEFVSSDGQLVSFRLPDGELRRCELNRLSPEDRNLVVELALGTALTDTGRDRDGR